MSSILPRYVVISPVRDEEDYIEQTFRSMLGQTVKPLLWVIVDDGSKDGTATFVRRHAEGHPFVHLLSIPRAGTRQPGAAIVHAFNRGYESLPSDGYDFVAKLDCDLSFGPDYFEKLIGRFLEDECLGIASGVYAELNKSGDWVQVKMPSYHAFGASKVVRRSCFEDIGGFVAARGWDTVDEIRAMNLGWRTCHFTDLQTCHHKPEGSGIGALRTSSMHGEIFYATGGGPLLLILKIFRRLANPPLLLNALALVLGYLGAVVRRRPMLVTKSEATCYRALLRQRVWESLTKPFAPRQLQSRH